MTNEMFKKEAFKKSVKDNVKFLYRKTIEEATQDVHGIPDGTCSRKQPDQPLRLR